MTEPILVGLDLGTGGVRAMAVTADGRPVAQNAVAHETSTPLSADRHEQSPHIWWQNVVTCLGGLTNELARHGGSGGRLQGIAVDGTSGTLVAIDVAGEPVRPALMYNDPRAAIEAEELNDLARSWCEEAGYRFDASYALAKIVWMARHESENFARCARFIHQADYVVGLLTGDFDVTDYCNALKSGYDLTRDQWPSWIAQLPGVAERLPGVVAAGTPIGKVSKVAAAMTGLPEGLTVVAGATDGVAAVVGAGLRSVGDYNTTLGTTLVFKGISAHIAKHPQGLVYSHKLPGDRWLPGAASNVGAAWIRAWFPDSRPADLDRAAAAYLPCRVAAYPLVGRGERFPFRNAAAERFAVPEPSCTAEAFAAFLTGTALVERLSYDVLDAVCDTSGGAVYCTGGGSASDTWMQCRADATGRAMHRPRSHESAFGSAILAAAGTVFSSLADAADAMTHVTRTFLPSASADAHYTDLYGRFREELARRRYLNGGG